VGEARDKKEFSTIRIVRYFRTHPPDPLPFLREGGEKKERGEAPLKKLFLEKGRRE